MDESIWDDGRHYYHHWIVFLLIFTPAAIINFVVFTLLLFTRRRSTSSLLLSTYLVFEDGLLAFFSFISCLINLISLSFAGAQSHCTFQSIYLCCGVTSTGYTLCCIAWNSDRKVRLRPGLAIGQVKRFHYVNWIWSLLIALLSNLISPSSRYLSPGGTYCLVPIASTSGYLFWILGVLFPACFLIHRYLRLFLYIRSSAEALTLGSQQYRLALERSIIAARRMFGLVFSFILCLTPIGIVKLYEAANHTSASVTTYFIVGIFLQLNSLINPCLYVYFNKGTRKLLMETWKFRCNRQAMVNADLAKDRRIRGRKLGGGAGGGGGGGGGTVAPVAAAVGETGAGGGGAGEKSPLRGGGNVAAAAGTGGLVSGTVSGVVTHTNATLRTPQANSPNISDNNRNKSQLDDSECNCSSFSNCLWYICCADHSYRVEITDGSLQGIGGRGGREGVEEDEGLTHSGDLLFDSDADLDDLDDDDFEALEGHALRAKGSGAGAGLGSGLGGGQADTGIISLQRGRSRSDAQSQEPKSHSRGHAGSQHGFAPSSHLTPAVSIPIPVPEMPIPSTTTMAWSPNNNGIDNNDANNSPSKSTPALSAPSKTGSMRLGSATLSSGAPVTATITPGIASGPSGGELPAASASLPGSLIP